MGKSIDLTGMKFGRWTAIKFIGRINSHSTWMCKCDCGKERSVTLNSLRRGLTKSCGCLNLERLTKHGGSSTREYKIWNSMIQRCTNPNDAGYSDYGGRFIEVDRRWLESFEAFYEDMGPRPSPEHSIERKDVNGNYCKENCVWADKYEQARNQRISKMNKTGVKGVHYNKKRGAYVASIYYKGKREEITGFKTLDEARNERIRLELKYWGKSS